MRIAVAGTHRSGKTSLVEAFGRAHAGFLVEPEPYEQLLEMLGEEPADDLSPESFERQLHHLCERIAVTRSEPSIIFDRSPLDFLAYLRAIDELRLGVSDWTLTPDSITVARCALPTLDLIAFVRPRRMGQIDATPSRSLRRLVDRYLSELILDDALGLLGEPGGPEVVELTGSTAARLDELTYLAGLSQSARSSR